MEKSLMPLALVLNLVIISSDTVVLVNADSTRDFSEVSPNIAKLPV